MPRKLLKRLVTHKSTAIGPQCFVQLGPPKNETVKEPRAGSKERKELCRELTSICCQPPLAPIIVGTDCSSAAAGAWRRQCMPFDHRLVAGYFFHACPETIDKAIETAIRAQPAWERTPVSYRSKIFDRAADLMAGPHRQRIIAAAMLGQGMTAIQAEHNVCQLIDYTRFNSNFLRDLTLSRCVTKGEPDANNLNHYHGLEGFFAAITPSDSLSNAGQLAITAALMGNGVVWKPSDYSAIACYRVFESILAAGLPAGVINFVTAEENCFLSRICANKQLAGVAFGGTTATLEKIWETVGENIRCYDRFPRIVGTGSGKSFHVVHSSADLPCAVANTIRAAFEMAGQKTTSCSRVYVQKSELRRFLDVLACEVQKLFVTHPMDYRCFMSALISKEAYDRVYGYLCAAINDKNCRFVCGGRVNCTVGYYVEPTVVLVHAKGHPLLTEEVRGPLLAVHAFEDLCDLVEGIGMAPYAVCGSIFAKDAKWAQEAVLAVRNLATLVVVNDRCSEELPAQQSLGGSRKSGPGSKAGSISYLLSYCSERSVREVFKTNSCVTYQYMRECPCPCSHCCT